MREQGILEKNLKICETSTLFDFNKMPFKKVHFQAVNIGLNRVFSRDLQYFWIANGGTLPPVG